jgi:hypothetical protein
MRDPLRSHSQLLRTWQLTFPQKLTKVLQTPQAAEFGVLAEFGAGGVLAIGCESHCGGALGMPPADRPFP